ncbi:Flp pilus assembly complex ATPase component TadA [Geomonas sp. Red32]|uniref:GspE/PulE family protein n=1 Tax=Geomonas sp. Red32 TaxID=2912856 RepID=UPI00202CF125|nr:type II/IV secretion system protein [Geomonas sp. Red32]MCM0080352.1 Flp pilus assembly complex ATPase component TadA [Geomonas sp. Red32]
MIQDAGTGGTERKDGAIDSGLEIAALLVKSGVLDQTRLKYAQRVRGKLVSQRTLLAVMLELRFFSREQLRETLRSNIVSVKLGALLVELGYLKQAELQAALAIQQETENARMLGEILVEQRFIEEYTLAEALAYQLGFRYLDVNPDDVDRTLLARVPPHFMVQHCFIPVRQEEGKIVVAIADPLNMETRKTAEKLFGANTVFAIATTKGIRDAFTTLKRGNLQAEGPATDEHTVTGIVNSIFEEALRERASDIHIEPMRNVLRVRFRRDGMLTLYKDFVRELALPLCSRIKVMAEADIAERRRHQDGRICYESAKSGITLDMRVSFYVTIYGEKIVLRLLSKKGEQLLDLKEIGMPPRMLDHFIDDAVDCPSGVLIVTGPTGSGKTSTLYSCVHYLNNLHTSIVTAEEPVEYVIEGIAQCSINQKIGVTFEETLRHIVRQDPDVIVLGEICDNFSAETAIQAALTGHKVLTTFHSEDSVGGLLRLMNMNIEPFLIASTVVCVLSQRLLRRVCPACSEPYLPTPNELRRIGYSNLDIRGAEFLIGKGCAKCRYSGYQGRIGVFEMLIPNELVKDAVLSKKTSYEVRKISTETTGMVTLLESGLSLASRGAVSLQDTVRLLPRIGKPRPIAEIRRLLGE